MLSILHLFLGFTLFFISLKDIKEGIIPDVWLCLLAALGIFGCGFSHSWSVLILGGLGYGLSKAYLFLKGREGLGFGDVKMMAASGFWLPLKSLPLFLMSAGGIGIMTALLWQRLYKTQSFPLGPALAFALGICILGQPVVSKGEMPMTSSFSGPSLAPSQDVTPDSLVIVIHGYGATGDNLLSLGKAWASILPKTIFVAPHGPAICEEFAEGRQWFGLKDWDFSRILREIEDIKPDFNRYIDGLIKTYNIPPERVAFVGFSQGAMMAILMALARPQCAGVVAYSGGFVGTLKDSHPTTPPILLVHGLEDSVVPASFSQDAETQLKALGIPVKLSLLPHLDHSIDERGLHLGGSFLKEILQ